MTFALLDLFVPPLPVKRNARLVRFVRRAPQLKSNALLGFIALPPLKNLFVHWVHSVHLDLYLPHHARLGMFVPTHPRSRSVKVAHIAAAGPLLKSHALQATSAPRLLKSSVVLWVHSVFQGRFFPKCVHWVHSAMKEARPL